LEENDQFGHSISLSGNKAVICAPYKSSPTIHIKPPQRDTPSEHAGACYVYSRKDHTSAFHLEQQLVPSNILAQDRFGWDVAMDGGRIIVGQMEKFEDKLSPSRPIQIIKTYCQDPPCQSPELSMFRLWSVTGKAFDYQPTYGDNSIHRAVYEGYGDASSHSSGEPQSSWLIGRYYIGKY
jgi:hypothetical protein